MRTAVCTLVRNRTDHLRRMLAGLARQATPADVVSVAVMGGEDPTDAAAGLDLPITWVDAASSTHALPLAAARNAARDAAGDVDALIFLDVDVIPSRTLLADYVDRLARHPAVWSGQVDYLPPMSLPVDPTDEELAGVATCHPARTPPPTDRALEKPELFWSLSFGLTASTFDDLGGFAEVFEGYGGEDTDFAFRVHRMGVDLMVTPDALGWHQHHEQHSPPLRHLVDICANATVFKRRWGIWPMVGWLEEFEADGLVHFSDTGSRVVPTELGVRTVTATINGSATPSPVDR